MKKFLRLPGNFCSFHRFFLQFKHGLPSVFCLRYAVLFLFAIVAFLYLRLAFFQNLSDRSISKATIWRVFLGNGSSRWVMPKMECERVFGGDKAFVQRMVRHRWKVSDPHDLEMSCEAILARHREDSGQEDHLTPKNDNITEVERLMPMAFARVIYTDYLFLEAELLVHYAHNNWYCYVLDSKSSAAFQLRVRQLASCFDNVIVVDPRFRIESNGVNMNKALMECVRALSDERKRWKYLVTLQNHDVQAKTNAEMAQIFTWLEGVNDVEVELRTPQTKLRLQHYYERFNWTFEALRLFNEEALNRRTDEEGNPLALNVSKGYMAVSLTREFVDFVVNRLNITTLLDQLNKGFFGMDEHFWQSLSSSESLDAPGGFPHKCFVERNAIAMQNATFNGKYKYITRFAIWADSSSKCLSGNWRHAVCVFGLENLMGSENDIRRIPHLFVNKLMQEFDFGAILCWHQWMRERRRAGRTELDSAFYRDWPQIRYQRERGKRKETGAHSAAVDCDSGKLLITKTK